MIETKYLNLLSKWRLVPRVLVYGIGVFFFTMFPIIVLMNNVPVGILAASMAGLSVTTLILMRNRFVKRLALTRTFDRFYHLQTTAELATSLTPVGLFLSGILFLYLLARDNLQYGLWALLTSEAFLVSAVISDLFDTMIGERKLAILCLRNFVSVAEEDFCKMHLGQIVRGLVQLEKVLSQVGLVVPHFELSFAINVARVTTESHNKLRVQIENFVDVLEHPENAASVSKAVVSSHELLSNAKGFTDVGMRVRYPLRKRLLSSSTLENVVRLASILSTTGSILYVLHGLGLLG